jgi:hypothetical protein
MERITASRGRERYFPNNMKKFFYSHPDTIIAVLALVFLGTLVAFYSWASNDIFVEVHKALTFSPSEPSNSFNLTGAAKLDLRGLLNDAPSEASVPAPAVTPVASTTAASTTANE